ncbi:MAG TPA: ion transporter [Campylobacterales bacterium]|nr:ion transporter [Campylobacterales bacterium]
MMTLQDKLYVLFEKPEENKASFIFNSTIYILIFISIVNLMFSSVESLQNEYGNIITIVRNIIMPIFVLEYMLRLYASGSLDQYKGVLGKFKYAKTPYAVIDLLAILPYILLNSGFNSAFIRSLRLLRIFRLFRVKKYAMFIQQMRKITSNMKEELVVLLFYTVVLLVMLSFAIYELEHDAQPEVFTNVFQTMWWAVATLTTVGYGDMYPVTALGKIITAFITIIGIAFVAIPGGMFASEFMSEINKNKDRKAEDAINKCFRCDSGDIEVYDDASMGYDNENLKQMYVCKKCQFTWLES